MIVVSLNYIAPLPEIDRLLEGHKAWLKAGYDDGIFVASGAKRPRTGGVILARCRRETLDAKLAADPFGRAGVAEYDVTEFAATTVAPGLGVLRES